MAKLKLRIPADLVVDLDLGDPVVRVPHWRTWPSDCPKEGEDLVIRFKLHGAPYAMIGYADGPEFFDAAGRTIFFDDGIYPDDFKPDTVFDDRTPNEIHWIPLDELLENVEDPDKSEGA